MLNKPKNVNEARAYRPAIPVFSGRKGAEVLKRIINTPAPDFTELDKEIDKMMAQVHAAEKNGERG